MKTLFQLCLNYVVDNYKMYRRDIKKLPNEIRFNVNKSFNSIKTNNNAKYYIKIIDQNHQLYNYYHDMFKHSMLSQHEFACDKKHDVRFMIRKGYHVLNLSSIYCTIVKIIEINDVIENIQISLFCSNYIDDDITQIIELIKTSPYIDKILDINDTIYLS